MSCRRRHELQEQESAARALVEESRLTDQTTDASPRSTRGRNAAPARLKNYAIAAGAVATAVGGVDRRGQRGDRHVVGSGPVWAGSVNAAGNQSNSAWGDAFLNNKFWAVVIQAGSTATGARLHGLQQLRWTRPRWAIVDGRGDRRERIDPLRSAAGVREGSKQRLQRGLECTAADVHVRMEFRIIERGAWLPRVPTRKHRPIQLWLLRSRVHAQQSAPGSTFAMTIHGWAYESTANQSITISGAAAVPGGTGLAALTFGAPASAPVVAAGTDRALQRRPPRPLQRPASPGAAVLLGAEFASRVRTSPPPRGARHIPDVA